MYLLLLLLLLFTPWEFFYISVIWKFSLEFEWRQVSLSLHDSSQYWGVISNAVVWMVSTRLPTSKSSSPFNNPLVTVPKEPITIDIIVTFMSHRFFQFPCKIEVFLILFTFFEFYSVVSQDSKVNNFSNSLFLVNYCKVWSSGRD